MKFYYLYFIIYLLSTLYYAIMLSQDIASKISLAFIIIYFSSSLEPKTRYEHKIYNNYTLLYTFITLIISISLFIWKINYIANLTQIDQNLAMYWDFSIPRNIYYMELDTMSMVYLLSIFSGLFTLITLKSQSIIKSIEHQKFKIEVTSITTYLIIGLLYSLAYLERFVLCKFWISICILFIVFNSNHFINSRFIKFKGALLRLTSLLVSIYLFFEYLQTDPNFTELYIMELINKSRTQLNFQYTAQILLITKIVIFILISRCVVWEINKDSLQILKNQELHHQQKVHQQVSLYSIYFIHIFTIIVLILEPTPGHIVLLCGFFINIKEIHPNYQPILLIGGIIMVYYATHNVVYIIYLLCVNQITIQPTMLGHFSFSINIITDFVRLVILLNNVSIINFLVGLFRNQEIVFFVILIRNTSELFNYQNEVIGVGYGYGINITIFNTNLEGDLIFLILLILFRFERYEFIYSAQILKKIEQILHIYRYFNWIAYIIAAVLILSSQQSVLLFIEFTMILSIICIGMLASSQRKHKILRMLWRLYLFLKIITTSIKYFFLFSKYQSTYQWLHFETLEENRRLIGLYKNDVNIRVAFIPDVILILVSLISQHILYFKIQYSQIKKKEERMSEQLTDSLLQNKQIKEQIIRVYETYIKIHPLQIKHKYLEILFKLFCDCFVDVNFLFIIVFYKYWKSNSSYYFFYFILYGFFYLKVIIFNNEYLQQEQQPSIQVQQSNKSNIRRKYLSFHESKRKILIMSIFISSIAILVTYFQTIWKAYFTLEFESEYQFISIFPHFSILIMSIISNEFTHVGSAISTQILIIKLRSYNQKITLEVLNGIILFLKNMVISYLFSNIVDSDMTSILSMSILIFYSMKVSNKYFLLGSFFILYLALLFLEFENIFILAAIRFYCFSKEKLYETLLFNQQILNEKMINESNQDALYSCSIKFIPTFVFLLSLPILLKNFKIINFILVIIVIITLLYLQFYQGTNIKFLKCITITILAYLIIFIFLKMYMTLFKSNFIYWMSRQSIFYQLLLFTNLFNFLIIQNNILRMDKSFKIIQRRSKIIGILGSYTENEIKKQQLKKIYYEKKKLLNHVQKIKKQIQMSKRQDDPKKSLPRFDIQSDKQEKHINILPYFYSYSYQQLCSYFYRFNLFIEFLEQINTEEIDNKYKAIIESFKQNWLDCELNRHSNEISTIQHREKQLQLLKQLQQNSRKLYFFKYFIYNFHYCILILLILWNFFGGILVSTVNIIVFAFIIPLDSKPKKFAWLTLFIFVIGITIFQFFIPFFHSSLYILLIYNQGDQNYIYQYILIVGIIIQVILLRIEGKQNNSSFEIQNIYKSFLRTTLNMVRDCKIWSSFDVIFYKYYIALNIPKNPSFFYRIFSKYNLKSGRDMYPYICTIQVIIFIYLFFFYDKIEFEYKKIQNSFQEMLSYNLFTKHMIIVSLVQILLMIADRCITTYNYFDKKQDRIFNFLLKYISDPQLGDFFDDGLQDLVVQQNINKKFKSKYDLPLIIKYLLHLTTLLSFNFFIYLYLPSNGQLTLESLCNNQNGIIVCAKKHIYLKGLMILYLIYFFFNALQIKFGFTRLKGRNVLMTEYTEYTMISMYLYKSFIAIPFLSQFKKILDWTLTSTALPLFHWLKFQDMHSRLFISKCEAQMLTRKIYGTQMWWMKYLMAPAGFLSIILIVFGPMIIYSEINPFAVQDVVIGASVSLMLEVGPNIQYQMFSNSHVSKIELIENISIQNQQDKNLYYIQLSKYPDGNSLLSEPAIRKIITQLQSNLDNSPDKKQFKFVLSVSIIQQQGGKQQIKWAEIKLNTTELKELKDILSYNTKYFQVKNFYSPFPGTINLQNLSIYSRQNYWEVYTTNNCLPLYYFTSTKFKVKFSVISFYLTYVLLISRLMKIYLIATVENVTFEGSEVERVLYLCNAVISARRLENFEQQEQFYFELMDLIRAPQKMKLTTGNYLEFRKKCI